MEKEITMEIQNDRMPAANNFPQTGRVIAVCTSQEKGTQKQEVPSANLKENWGIEGDAHAGNWHR